MGTPYNPFKKPLEDLVVDDLVTLRSVREGWYVEYKETVPNPPSIAKSVSAFANTHGGYLFYGVREKSKADNVAAEFPGIPLDDLESMQERIRQSISAHSAPAPYFHMKVLSGPSEALGLANDRSIICIHVPWSARAPHVHKNGVVYRRVSDSSEPIAENDRHELGELFKRSDKLLTMYRSWYDAEPNFSDAEKRQPYLRLLITFDPWRERAPRLPLPIEDVRKLFNPVDDVATLPFDSIYSTRDGFIARQTKGNGLDTLTLTWALRRDLTSEILVPIHCLRTDHEQDQQIELAGYEQEERFISVLSQHKYHSLSVLDLNQLYLIFTGIFQTLERIWKAINWKHGFFATFKTLNADRSCSFIDIARVIERYEKNGIPVSLSFMSPLSEHHHPDTFIEFKQQDEEGEYLDAEFNAAILMFNLARNFGIPMWEDVEHDYDVFEALRLAAGRSMTAQSLRNKQQ